MTPSSPSQMTLVQSRRITADGLYRKARSLRAVRLPKAGDRVQDGHVVGSCVRPSDHRQWVVIPPDRVTAGYWVLHARWRPAFTQVSTAFSREVLIIPGSWVRAPPAPPPGRTPKAHADPVRHSARTGWDCVRRGSMTRAGKRVLSMTWSCCRPGHAPVRPPSIARNFPLQLHPVCIG